MLFVRRYRLICKSSASCSVPFIYTAASLLAKDPKTGEAVSWDPSPQRWIDGSVDNDIPMTRLAEMFNVNHFIVSQVNPHVVPFLAKDEKVMNQEDPHMSIISPGPSWLENFSQLAKGEAVHRMRTLAELGLFPNLLTKTVSVLSQKYSGDITIFPEISYADFPRMLSNPTPEYMHMAMLSGQRATWPRLSVIKNHCAIELALDDAVQKLRARVVFSDEEVATRNLTASDRRSLEVQMQTKRPLMTRRPQSSRESLPAVAQMTPIITKTISQPTQNIIPHKSVRAKTFLDHNKSLSINTLVDRPKSPDVVRSSRPSTADAATLTMPPPDRRAGVAPRHLHDLTSSGAEETSNLSRSSSSTSLDLSSPTESPSSPAETIPKCSRSLFGSSSQPATPSAVSDFLSMSTADSRAKTSLSPPPPPFASNSLRGRSTPEARSIAYHFHRPRNQDRHATQAETPSSRPVTVSSKSPHTASAKTQQAQSSNPKPSHPKKWSMEIDIPAKAKGLVTMSSRRKEKRKETGNSSGPA